LQETLHSLTYLAVDKAVAKITATVFVQLEDQLSHVVCSKEVFLSLKLSDIVLSVTMIAEHITEVERV